MHSIQPTRSVFVLLWLVLATLQPLSGLRAQPAPDRWQELERRPGEGEQCLVCGQTVHGDEVVEIRFRGRRFVVKASMLGDFEGDPDQYFAALEARSALFDEMAARPEVSPLWLWVGGYIFVGLLFAALCGYLAVSRGLAPVSWFFAGLAGNVAALVVLLVTPRGLAAANLPGGLTKVPRTHTPVACDGCGASNHPAASRCAGCNAALQPTAASETETLNVIPREVHS